MVSQEIEYCAYKSKIRPFIYDHSLSLIKGICGIIKLTLKICIACYDKYSRRDFPIILNLLKLTDTGPT